MRRLFKLLFPIFLGGIALVLLVPLLMRLSVSGEIYSTPQDVPEREVAIVLGASVVRGEPSPVLAARADTAAELYLNQKVKKILVTGDSSTSTHDEVTPVRKYLVSAGVKQEDIFLDHAGFDTYSSMYRAHVVFGATSAIIATQGFHMPRSLFIAHMQGIDAVGVLAKEGDDAAYAYGREILASWKALLDIALKREPKYLGEPIPLSGDGQVTW